MSKKISAVAVAFILAASSFTVADAATAQKFTFKLVGKCIDSAFEGTIEEDTTGYCAIAVTVNPAKPFRTVNLQYKDENGKWQFANDDNNDKIAKKTDAFKKVEVNIPQYDEDGVFFDFEKREYRVYIPKSGTAAGVASKTFLINYIGAGGEGDNVDTVEP